MLFEKITRWSLLGILLYAQMVNIISPPLLHEKKNLQVASFEQN
jgi:hypothetical protein